MVSTDKYGEIAKWRNPDDSIIHGIAACMGPDLSTAPGPFHHKPSQRIVPAKRRLVEQFVSCRS